MKYQVEIIETLSRVVEVEATCAEEAEQQIHSQYHSGEIVLDGDDCVDTEIKVLPLLHD